MVELLNKYYTLIKYGFFSIDDLKEMPEHEITMLFETLKK